MVSQEKNGFYEGKNVLVAGGTGLIGIQLVDLLIKRGANVRIASLDDPSRAHSKAEFHESDLTYKDNCMMECRGMDYVFNLLCKKGSPKVMQENPYSIMTPMLMFNTNLLDAVKRIGVERYLFSSTVGVYNPSELSHEDEVWETFPSRNDWFAGWAKRIGELQVEAAMKEFDWNGASIVRPANTYGPYDNFDGEGAIIPSNIKRAFELKEGEPFVAWGDGSPIRDFAYSEDIARGMLLAMEKGVDVPVNLGSGKGYSIKEAVQEIVGNMENPPEVKWDTSQPGGDNRRLMDSSRAKDLLGWEPQVSLEEGIRRTMDWYKENRGQ
jgi:GDP-L-fucose synthase|tara:strand:- start:2949 stop:3920 length:972 start_codon:yes stop_codon:yes gene_type:complete